MQRQIQGSFPIRLRCAARARAQSSDRDWQKDYPVGSGAALTVETGDSNLDIHSCGDCKAIRIHVIAGEKLTNFRLEEHQDQNHVYFLLKEKMHIGFEIHWNANHGTQVIVETPSNLELDATTADGNLSTTPAWLIAIRPDKHHRAGYAMN